MSNWPVSVLLCVSLYNCIQWDVFIVIAQQVRVFGYAATGG